MCYNLKDKIKTNEVQDIIVHYEDSLRKVFESLLKD